MTARNSKAGARVRFDVAALRKLAGGKVFERGEDYHADGQVEILSLEPERVLAEVAGTDDYRIVLTGRGKKIGGECSCPAFSDWGFCKHMVATALAANEVGDSGASPGTGALARIRTHLKAKGVDALVGMIVDLAERDPALFRKLDMAAAPSPDDEKALEAHLRRSIDGATRTGGFIDYRDAAGWADQVAEALDAVGALASGARAGLAARLAEHAIGRIEQAIASIDDSDGHGGALLEKARDIHLAACRTARPDAMKLARALFNREMTEEYETFYRAAAVYAEVLGDAGLDEYRRLAGEAWQKPLTPGSHDESSDSRDRLEGMLDFFAERRGDTDERIALRSRDLRSPWQYLRLAEFCLQAGRKDEALRRAEEGLWLFEDKRPDERLTLFAVGLLAKAGRKSDAESHLWRAFEKAPSHDLYKRLRKLSGTVARDRAFAFLEAQLPGERKDFWFGASELLIRLMILEKAFDAAWSTLERHGASPSLRQTLADASKTSHPEKAIAVYAELVEEHARFGRYEDARTLVHRMAGLRDARQQAAYIEGLVERHRRKRNFMKLLGWTAGRSASPQS